MSLRAPRLSRLDVTAALTKIHKRRHRLNTVLYAAADDALAGTTISIPVAHRGQQTFRVRVAVCELALREALDGRDRDGLPLVVLASHATQLPLDLQATVARGAIQFITDEQRVRTLFDNDKITLAADLVASPLFRALVHDSHARFPKARGVTLSLRHAWISWLHIYAKIPLAVQLSADQLLTHGLSAPPLADFEQALSAVANLDTALEAWLRAEFGPVTVAVLRVWRSGFVRPFAALGLIVESIVKPPAITGDEGLEQWLGGRLEDLELSSFFTDVSSRSNWVAWCSASRTLLHRMDDHERDSLIKEADLMLASVRSAGIGKRVGSSVWLQTAWADATQKMADGLRQVRIAGKNSDWQAARESFTRLQAHRNTNAGALGAEIFRAARYGLRLLGWLRSNVAAVPTAKRAEERLAAIAAAYVSHGAWVDQLRRKLRLLAAGPLQVEIDAVLAAVDVRVDDWNAAFTAALGTWHRRGRPVGNVLPIERALGTVAAKFLGGEPSRRLAVLVLDGLSWAKATELLPTLGVVHWGSATWRASGAPNGMNVPPVLAALPTETAFSRAALLGGALLTAGAQLPTSRDVSRFAAHRELRAFVDRQAGPRLLLGKDAVDATGKPTQELVRLLESQDRLVGAVLNVADDQLHGSGRLRASYELRDLHGLERLLDLCAEAGRAILLCADHGHVLGQRLQTRTDLPHDGAKSRWRPLSDAKDGRDGELVLSAKEGVWVPPGSAAIALLGRETDTHRGGVGEGTHGGVSLAEVVAPMVLLSTESLAEGPDGDDAPLRPAEPARPGWWEADRWTQAPPKKSRRVKRSSPAAQLPIEAAVPTAVRSASSSTASPSSAAAVVHLAETQERALKVVAEMLPARSRTKALLLLRTALSEGGTVSSARAAHACATMEHRISGLVALISEQLNLDGYVVISHDAIQHLVTVDAAQIELLFDPRRERG